MTRRDYLQATLLGSGALLLQSPSPAEMLAKSFDGYGGEGDYRFSNGNTYAVMAEGHRLRDRAFKEGSVVDTGEQYDCVVAGGGISGLASALFFQRKANGKSLVLDDHPIFGGLAKRNEFVIDGLRTIGNQASAMFFPQFEGTFLDQFYRSIGIDQSEFVYQKWASSQPDLHVGTTPYFGGGNNSAFFFGKRFGEGSGKWVKDPWGQQLKDAPISQQTREELLRTRSAPPEALPQTHGDALSRHMDSITLERHLMDRFRISQETVRTFLSPVAGGGAGIGADALSAYAEYAADVLFPWDQTNGPQMFPGGNAGVARHILKALLPDAISGDRTMAGICRGAVNFGALDRDGSATRLRLRSTIASIEHEGEPGKAQNIRIVYSRDGQLYRVRARHAIVTSGSWTAKYIVQDLPSSHREAYAQFHRSPALVANVAVRNWRFLYKLGISEAQWFEGIGNYLAVRKLATFGDVPQVISPDSPVALTLKILFSYPGLPLEEQERKGRLELLSTTYAEYERRIRSQFDEMFRASGFDAKRDIAGIVLNRWGHAYLSAQPGFFFGAAGKPAPGEVIRNHPVGRIAFANSDVTGIMDHRASIQEANRAVEQLL